ncbi:hypothetical protein FKM82_003145 [Ascaphus truei]
MHYVAMIFNAKDCICLFNVGGPLLQACGDRVRHRVQWSTLQGHHPTSRPRSLLVHQRTPDRPREEALPALRRCGKGKCSFQMLYYWHKLGYEL